MFWEEAVEEYPVWHPYASCEERGRDLVVGARGSKLFLHDGREVIDAIGSWWTSLFGHSYAPLVEVMREQAARLDHVLFADILHEPALLLAQKLSKKLSYAKVFFSDNGSTAVEVAMKLAIQRETLRRKKRFGFAAFEGAYHGDTIGAMSLQGKSLFSRPYAPLLRPIFEIPFVETWRGDEEVEQREKKAFRKIERLLDSHEGEIGAFLFEPLIQGSSGMRMVRPSYLFRVCEMMRERGITLIADEVMTGFGRTGAFLASVKAGLHPDILCLSKGLTGGMLPLGVTCVSEKFLQPFRKKDAVFFHGHTFTANPISCALGGKVIDLLEENPSLYSSFERRYEPFFPVVSSLPLVKKIRSMGNVFALQLDVKTSYGSPFSKGLRKRFWEKGVLIRPLGNTLYLLPAYTIKEEELQKCFQTLSDVICEVACKKEH